MVGDGGFEGVVDRSWWPIFMLRRLEDGELV